MPTNNYYQGGIPNQVTAQNFGGRFDYNHSGTDRFFFRASGTTFYEYNVDWTYETKYAGLHSNDKTRASWSYTGNWTKVRKSMVVDTQFSANRFYEDQQRRGLHEYKPSDVGLPTYLDEFCLAVSNCMLPTINIAGYQGVSTNADGGLETTNFQAQSSVTNVMGKHTLRGGVDYRLAMRKAGLMAAGNVSSTYNFDNLYTRAADTTSVFPASNIGLEPGLADARHPDAGVDRPERADLDEQSVLRRVLPGHVARRARTSRSTSAFASSTRAASRSRRIAG